MTEQKSITDIFQNVEGFNFTRVNNGPFRPTKWFSTYVTIHSYRCNATNASERGRRGVSLRSSRVREAKSTENETKSKAAKQTASAERAGDRGSCIPGGAL